MLREVPVCEFYLKLEMDRNKEYYRKRKDIVSRYGLRKIF